MKTIKIISAGFLCLLFACGGSESTSDSAEADVAEDVTSSCLADLIEGNEIEKMITAQQLAKLVGKTEADLELKDNKSRSAEYSTMAYNWEPEEERIMIMEMKSPKAGGGEHVIKTESPVPNKVIFGNIDVIDIDGKDPKEYFRYTYGPKTAEEKEAIKKNIDKSKEQSDKVDEKSAEALKGMVDKQSSAELSDVGDLAYWSTQTYSNVTDAKVKVLHGNTMFEVAVDVSNDTQEDLAVAKKVSQQIIANCQ